MKLKPSWFHVLFNYFNLGAEQDNSEIHINGKVKEREKQEKLGIYVKSLAQFSSTKPTQIIEQQEWWTFSNQPQSY